LENQSNLTINTPYHATSSSSTATINEKLVINTSEYADTKETRTQLLSGYRLAMAIISLDILVFLSAIDMTI
ncbi:hypothetical protein EC988_005966, partial [Linderina pennispora]